MLLSLDWAGGAYAWADPHVAAPLALGLALLVLFALYGKYSTVHPQCTSFFMIEKKLAHLTSPIPHTHTHTHTHLSPCLTGYLSIYLSIYPTGP